MALNLKFDHFSFRPVVMDDAEMMLTWRNEPEVRNGMFHSRAFTLEEQVPWLESVLSSDQNHYYIFENQGRPSGMFGVYDIKPDQRVGEWVYFMGARYPGLPKGAGAAMEFIAIDTFFYRHGLRRLWGRTLRANARVWQMHQRFGFQVEGSLREHILKDGELIDLLVVGLLEPEWRNRRAEQFAAIFSEGELLPPPAADYWAELSIRKSASEMV